MAAEAHKNHFCECAFKMPWHKGGPQFTFNRNGPVRAGRTCLRIMPNQPTDYALAGVDEEWLQTIGMPPQLTPDGEPRGSTRLGQSRVIQPLNRGDGRLTAYGDLWVNP
jgi:hypothetical protein